MSYKADTTYAAVSYFGDSNGWEEKIGCDCKVCVEAREGGGEERWEISVGGRID